MSVLPTGPAEFQVRLRCGTLRLQVEHAEFPLDELCTFGTRRNPRRRFLIISKVLGKHVPVRPALMACVHDMLARRLGVSAGPAVVVALAETAIGLGHGVFEAFLRQTGRQDVLFLHSTRYRLDRPVALSFCENHSHATEHLIYVPDDPCKLEMLRQARTLILVDDEITTGRTLADLAGRLIARQPRLESVQVVSITDWLEPQARAQMGAQMGRPVVFHHLLRGRLRFEAAHAFTVETMPNVVGRGDRKDALLSRNHGRFGLTTPVMVDVDRLPLTLASSQRAEGTRILVLGTGEFAHPPFLLARHLEQLGLDVYFQATTRSPALVGDGIASALEFVDNYDDDIPNFVYNVADKRYDRIIVCYETRPLPAAHCLVDMLGAEAVFF